MSQPWYKSEIINLIQPFVKQEPYSFWNKHFFESTDREKLSSIDNHFVNVAITMGTLERLKKTVALWGDDNAKNAVAQASLLTQLYICLVYPRDSVLKRLAKELEENSAEGKLCRHLVSKDSDFRHVRNSLAHGSYKFGESGMVFEDKNSRNGKTWEKEISLERLRLDCLLVFDMFMSAKEASLGTIN